MAEIESREEHAMRYLLGTLSEEERARLEERYFYDDAAFEEIEIAEEELVDRYVRGELSKDDAAKFESALAASPRLTERVQFGRNFADKVRRLSSATAASVDPVVKTPPPVAEKVSWWTKLFGSARTPQFALASSVLVLLVGGIPLLFGWLRLRDEQQRIAAQQAALEQRQREIDRQAADLKSQVEQFAKQTPQTTPTETPSPTKEESQPTIGSSILAISLSPGGGVRSGGGGKSFRIQRSTSKVAFTLDVGDTDYQSYQVIITTPDNTAVHKSGWMKLQVTRSGPILTFTVPAKALAPGDYSIQLNGRTRSSSIAPIADYPFRVIN